MPFLLRVPLDPVGARLTVNELRVSFLCIENVLELMQWLHHCDIQKDHGIVYIKDVYNTYIHT